MVDGLSSNVVRSIIQDQKGFIWVGTNEGLDVYDGYSFKRRSLLTSDSLFTSFESITELYEDKSGMIWAGSRDGLFKINPHTDNTTSFLHDLDDTTTLSHNNIFALIETEPGILWVGTEHGVNRLNVNNGRITRYEHDQNDENTLSSNLITALEVDSRGTLWVGTKEGLCRFNPATNSFTRFTPETNYPFGSHHNFIRSLEADSTHNVLWVGTQRGLSMLNLETLQFSRIPTPFDQMVPERSLWIIALHLDSSGTLWIGSDRGGLVEHDPVTESWAIHPLQPEHPHSLSDKSVRTILKDKTGILWIGLWDGGLYKERRLKAFTIFTHIPDAPDSALSNPVVTAIHPSAHSEIIWIGTFGGLNALDPRTGHIEHFQHVPNNSHSLSSNEIWAIEESRSGILWIATAGGGLNRMDPAQKTFKHFRHQLGYQGSINSDYIFSVLEDATATLWVGSSNKGLSRFSSPNEQFTIPFTDSTTNKLNHYAIWTLLSSRRDSTLWIGTQGGGLNRYDPIETHLHSYMHIPGDSSSISGDFVQSIYEDSVSDLWIGTMGRGLNRYDRASDRFYWYTTDNGLPHNTVTCITGGRDGERWVSTLNGLAQFDLHTQRFTQFDRSDGLPSNIFRENACYEGSDGVLYFGSEGGLVAFHPEQIQLDTHAPSVALTGIDLFNSPLRLDSSVTYKKLVQLQHNQNVLTFHFSALHYASPSDNEYAYQLEGINQRWHYVGSNQRAVTYATLSPGSYVFRVKAANSDGVWNEKGVSMHLVITPPYWQTWWFQFLVALGSVTVSVSGCDCGQVRFL